MVYGFVLGFALVALAVDRLILSDGATGPQSAAAADEFVSDETSPASASKPMMAASPGAVQAPSLANRLQNLAQERKLILTDVEDAFRPNLNWVGVARPEVVPVASTKPQVGLSEVESFKSRHRLMAVLQNSEGGAAIVGNHTILIGQNIEGFRLVSLTKRSAVFEKDQARVELSLPSPRLPTGD